MSKHSQRLLCCLLLAALASLAAPSDVNAQPQFYPPHELYKFHMGSTNGFYYTPWYSQGSNPGWTFQGPIGSGLSRTAGIYPNPQNGYTPAPSTGLLPLYQHTVIQGFRSYTHLSIWFGGGSGYYFNGIAGYVYPPSTTVDPFGNPTVKVSAWYSQSYGYWYGLGEPGDPGGFEFPPNGTYAFHGVPFRLPSHPTFATQPLRCQQAGFCTFQFQAQYDPPPPPPECDPYQEQYCYDTGGWWDSGSCSCNYW